MGIEIYTKDSQQTVSLRSWQKADQVGEVGMVNIGNAGPNVVFGLAFDGIGKARDKRRIHAGLFGLKSMHAFRRHRIILL